MNKAKYFIQNDMYRYYGKEKIGFIEKIKLRPEQKYIYLLRKAQFSNNMISKIYYSLRLRLKQNKTMIQIPKETKIGKGFYISHCGRIIINPKVVLGENINISTGVVIGQTNRGNNKGTPIIGNNVWIGANSVIVGKIIVEDNVLIAPNTYVNFNIPRNSIVLGNPGIIHKSKDACKGYINNAV